MKNLTVFMLALCLLSGVIGCATMPVPGGGRGSEATVPDDGRGSMANPIHSTGGVKTLSAEPIFVEPGGQTICVFFGDNSGHGVDLKPAIAEKLQAKGLILVDRPDQADYIVNARLTYLGYCKDYPDQPYMGRILGTAAGAGAGAVIGNDTGQQAIWGAGLGLVGLLIGAAIDRANTPDLYFGSVSLQVKQRLTFLGDVADNRPITNDHKTTVTTTKNGKTETIVTEQKDENTATPIETSVSASQSGAANIKVVTQQKVSDFETHQTTLSGLAKVVRADTNAAVNELAEYLANAVAGIF